MEVGANRVSIAIVEPIGGHGGNEFYDFGLCKSVAEEGFDVCFYTCDETRLDEKFSFPFTTKKLFNKIYGKDNKFIRGYRFVNAVNKIVRDLNKRNVKLVHMHFYHFS